MIEKQEIDGRPAMVAYLTENMEPASKDDWRLAKVMFEDGEIVFVTNVKVEEAAGD
jgi:predicted SnoaL-like aldol condensation-catalyzing enzyme